ncbi:hypothetical protein RJT34_03772 [Clitoria ternatea]|uniref:Uncharacterized protein n=1 Tax=Clitoria ternatea TaxID=43366 RepID=A0AAN9KJM1_CLITE
MSSRHRPLHACGVSILAIGDIILGKTQDINGPIGSTLRKIAELTKFATPFIYAMQYQWLAILSFIDNGILTIERIAEKLFPPSTRVFDKVDEIVLTVMSLPEKFDGAVNKFPTVIHEVPFLEWTLTLVITRLNSLVSTLNHSRVNEKTIGVDNESASDDISSENLETFPPIISENEHKGVHDLLVSSHMKGSYKEALERGKEEETIHEKRMENGEKIDECEMNNDGVDDEEYESIMKCQEGRGEGIKDDPLLELLTLQGL